MADMEIEKNKESSQVETATIAKKVKSKVDEFVNSNWKQCFELIRQDS